MPGMAGLDPAAYGVYAPPQQHAQSEALREFWVEQMRDVQSVPCDPAQFKNHQLPLARIKKAGMEWGKSGEGGVGCWWWGRAGRGGSDGRACLSMPPTPLPSTPL